MNSINGALTAIFDVLLLAFEWAGTWFSLVMVSGIFGILALIAFKHISYQRGIKAAKDRIKGHLIEIRIYQDDLGIVSKAIGKVLARNLQYVTYNFGPFVPLAIPFVLVVAQLVTRYGFEPLPVHPRPELVGGAGGGGRVLVDDRQLAGAGTTITIEFRRERANAAAGMTLELPEGLVAVSPLVRSPGAGKAFQEVVAVQPGVYDLAVVLADGERVTKRLVAGEEGARAVRAMQPERVRSFLAAMLWPAEGTLSDSSGIERIVFVYPERDLGWFPGGPLGVILVFLVASMAFGFALLKPLGIQI